LKVKGTAIAEAEKTSFTPRANTYSSKTWRRI